MLPSVTWAFCIISKISSEELFGEIWESRMTGFALGSEMFKAHT